MNSPAQTLGSERSRGTNFIGHIVASAVLIFIACAISLMYTWLADGGNWAFFITALFTPLILPLYLVYKKDKDRHKHWRAWFAGIRFWICFIWAALPPILNTMSIVLDRLGFHTESNFVYGYRYASILVWPVVVLAVYVFIIKIKVYILKFRSWCLRHHLTECGENPKD